MCFNKPLDKRAGKDNNTPPNDTSLHLLNIDRASPNLPILDKNLSPIRVQPTPRGDSLSDTTRLLLVLPSVSFFFLAHLQHEVYQI